MISVLIPVYNIEVVSLVKNLDLQLKRFNIKGEIIVFDDYSSSYYRELNCSIRILSNVKYKELDKNYGRTAIRQLLADQANYDWLIFVDADSRIIYDDFLYRYITNLSTKYNVYSGGTVYPTMPINCAKRLHWKYGSKREAVKGRRSAFHTNNFCIARKTFQQLEFPDFLKHYGHEDTWMGIELERMKKNILNIRNPVEHLNIEDTKVFLDKTQFALSNLLTLQKTIKPTTIGKHVDLYRLFIFIKKIRFESVITFFYRAFQKRILTNLHSCNPSLKLFDFYRLYHLIKLSEKNQHGNSILL